MSILNRIQKARFRIKENFTYQLRDKNGNTKKMFQVNTLGRVFLQTFRRMCPNATEAVVNSEGEVVSSTVKTGVLPYLAAYGLRVPFLTGRYVTSMQISNLITNVGKAGVASRINGAGSENAFTYIAIGTGTTAAAATDTTLETEISTGGGSRASATASRTTTDVTNDTARLVNTFNFTSTFAVTEAGALNAASSGVLLNRQVFSAVNVVNGDSLQVTIDIDVD